MVSYRNVRIDGGFWGQRQETNRRVTLPLEHEQCSQTGRFDGFTLDWHEGQPNPPHPFYDSDVAKWVEAVAYSLGVEPDEGLRVCVGEVVERIISAQQPDGYLNSYFTRMEPHKRWTNLRDRHELYCAGHLMEAAVALFEATGDRRLLEAMCRYADYIASVFGPEEGKKRGYPGHEEIELALIKLYRATGEQRYLRLAKFFLDERGTLPHYFDLEAIERGELAPMTGDQLLRRAGVYDGNQSHLPVREQRTAEGHAVRACYLYAGMADVARETGDAELVATCRAIWENITTRRMYVTGGVGSAYQGERFTFDYDLPNEEAYAETCAAIALVFFAHRMLHLELDGRYADSMERALYNGVASGVSLDGKQFFYVNPLSQTPSERRFGERRRWVTKRQDWFGCACCPPNIARLFASIGDYLYSQTESELAVHLYARGTLETELGGTRVLVKQQTDYPWDGKVALRLAPEAPAQFALRLRIPQWCRDASIAVNGKQFPCQPRNGYVHIAKTWNAGDTVVLDLPMPVERIEAHPAVRHDCGRIALQRGPLVYCLEQEDNGPNLHDVVLPRDAQFAVSFEKILPGGVAVIEAEGLRRDPDAWQNTLYATGPTPRIPVRIKAMPYCCWANRGEGEMIVWILDGR